MTDALTLSFVGLSGAALIGFPLYAWRTRGRLYGLFSLGLLGTSLPALAVLHGRLSPLLPAAGQVALAALFAYGTLAAVVHLAGLTRPRLRPLAFRAGISIPGMVFVSAGGLGLLWLLALLPVRVALVLTGEAAALAALRWADWAPIALAVLSVPTSARPTREVVRFALDGRSWPVGADGRLVRVPVARRRATRRVRTVDDGDGVLRLVQLTDTHLGPWQTVAGLRRRIAGLVAEAPDLVLLTGDFLTMESAGTPGALAAALEPLAALRGRCFAVRGNHDLEAPAEVRHGLEANGVRLLVDDEAVVATRVGPVQIVGADWVGRGRREQLARLFARFPRRPGHVRLLLLHDPSGFRHVPPDEVDLVLSGHTHGGQLGLVSLGLAWTVLRGTAWPDHGLFGRGTSRLYVHRGTGHYGFPLRVGVPGELSLLEVELPRARAA